MREGPVENVTDVLRQYPFVGVVYGCGERFGGRGRAGKGGEGRGREGKGGEGREG